MKSSTANFAAQDAATDRVRSIAGQFLRAGSTIPLRQWALASGIALLLLVAYIMGIVKEVLGIGPGTPGWHAPEIGTHVITFFMAAYFFLLAVKIAESGVSGWQPLGRRLVAATAAATVATVAVETTLIALLPSDAGWNFVPHRSAMIPKMIWSLANWLLCGGLAAAVYAHFRSAARAREAFEAAEFERATSSREVLATRLAATQARVEPQFLLSTLSQIEAMFDRDVHSGDRMLDGLIAYLRAALPQLRSENSTLECEARLCESYLRIAELRMGSRLAFALDIPGRLGSCVFPPMLLLPLVDDALRNGLEPLPFGGRIDIRAHGEDDRLQVVVSHDGVLPLDGMSQSELSTTLRGRLASLYGPNARLTYTVDAARHAEVAIEVPYEDARDHC